MLSAVRWTTWHVGVVHCWLLSVEIGSRGGKVYKIFKFWLNIFVLFLMKFFIEFKLENKTKLLLPYLAQLILTGWGPDTVMTVQLEAVILCCGFPTSIDWARTLNAQAEVVIEQWKNNIINVLFQYWQNVIKTAAGKQTSNMSICERASSNLNHFIYFGRKQWKAEISSNWQWKFMTRKKTCAQGNSSNAISLLSCIKLR